MVARVSTSVGPEQLLGQGQGGDQDGVGLLAPVLHAQVGGEAAGAADAHGVVGAAGGQRREDGAGPPVEGLGPDVVAEVVEGAGQGLAGRGPAPGASGCAARSDAPGRPALRPRPIAAGPAGRPPNVAGGRPARWGRRGVVRHRVPPRRSPAVVLGLPPVHRTPGSDAAVMSTGYSRRGGRSDVRPIRGPGPGRPGGPRPASRRPAAGGSRRSAPRPTAGRRCPCWPGRRRPARPPRSPGC